MTLLERTEHHFAATSQLTNYDFKFIISECHFDEKANVIGFVSNMFSKSLGKKVLEGHSQLQRTDLA